MKDRLMRYLVYFRRGHSMYLVFAISFLNFLVLQYYLLIERIPALKTVFAHLYVFMVVFLFLYIPISVWIGWWDYKRGTIPVDANVSAKASPYVKDVTKAWMLFMEGKKEEAVERLRKWVE